MASQMQTRDLEKKFELVRALVPVILLGLSLVGLGLFMSTSGQRAKKTLNQTTTNFNQVSNIYLQNQVHEIFRENCFGCHGESETAAGIDVSTLAALSHSVDFSVALNENRLWRAIAVEGTMPEGGEKLDDQQLSLVKTWIEKGAPTGAARVFVSRNEVASSIRRFYLSEELDSEKYWIFDFSNLHNNPNLTGRQIANSKSDFVRLINQLSWSPTVYVPEVIDDNELIYAVDIRKLHWSESTISLIESNYPYGVRWPKPTFGYAEQKSLEELSRFDIPVIRADWFISTCSIAPIYNQILELPSTLGALFERLNVDVFADIESGNFLRGGTTTSNVTLSGRRVIDRFEIPVSELYPDGGYLYVTWDFAKKNKRDHVRFPFGPARPNNPFSSHAFDHDGVEVIFSLPNGAHGYFINDAVGNSIALAPYELVRDQLGVTGAAQISNGASCIACHDRGLRQFETQRPDFEGKLGEEVERQFGQADELIRCVQADNQQFQKFVKSVEGEYSGEGKRRRVSSLGPIARTSSIFQRRINSESLRYEFGVSVETPFHFEGGIHVSREQWQDVGKGLNSPTFSMYQTIARDLGVGEPLKIEN